MFYTTGTVRFLTVVRWNIFCHNDINVKSGIWQDGMLSPYLLNIYISSIISALKMLIMTVTLIIFCDCTV